MVRAGSHGSGPVECEKAGRVSRLGVGRRAKQAGKAATPLRLVSTSRFLPQLIILSSVLSGKRRLKYSFPWRAVGRSYSQPDSPGCSR